MALSKPRTTQRRLDGTSNDAISVPPASAQTFYPGALVAVNASGLLVPGSTATTLTAVGVFGEQPFLVPATSYLSAAATEFQVQVGTFKFSNSGGDPVVQADLGKACYIVDDETVCHTGTGKSLAGVVVGIDDSEKPTGAGVWVAIGRTPAALVGSAGPTGSVTGTGERAGRTRTVAARC